jgi:hypothetical protein
MKKFCFIISFLLLFAGCEKEPGEMLPHQPKISPSSVTLEEGEKVEITVKDGILPYTVETSSDVITATVKGSILTITGIKFGTAIATISGKDGGEAEISVTVTEKSDPLATFRQNPIPRWEFPDGMVIESDDTKFVFISDGGGNLFSPSQKKWGYASPDGMSFRLLEWGTSPLVRTEKGTAAISNFQLVKEEEGRVWAIFTLNGSEHRVVGEKVK